MRTIRTPRRGADGTGADAVSGESGNANIIKTAVKQQILNEEFELTCLHRQKPAADLLDLLESFSRSVIVGDYVVFR